MKISAVIITYNEERNISRCLNSIKKVADEIIVVDSFSNDNTILICESFNAEIYQRKFDGYGDQKNYGIEHAAHNYILSLDADEALSHQLQLSILELRQQATNKAAYQFNRRNHIDKKWVNYGVWYPDCKMRLWDKNKGQWNLAFVHEKVDLQPGTKPMLLKGDLFHFTAATFYQLRATNEKYATLGALQLFKNGKKYSFIDTSLRPLFAFFKAYFIKLGFLDGWMGIKLAHENARYTHLKYFRLKSIIKEAKNVNA